MIAGTHLHLVDFREAWPPLRARCWRFVPAESAAHAARMCDENRAVALGSIDGLTVLALETDDGVKMRANVLLAASTGQPGAFRRQETAMVTVARDMGASEMVFWTNRVRAWASLLGPEWRRDGDKFARSIP